MNEEGQLKNIDDVSGRGGDAAYEKAVAEHPRDHESQEYIDSRPDWVYGKGKIPALNDYYKLSCEDEKEMMTLAQFGQTMVESYFPGVKLYFTQALALGAILHPGDKYRSIVLISCTRYGKTYLTALASTISAFALEKEVRVGGATKDKADLVMEKIVSTVPSATPTLQNGMVIGDDDNNVNKKVARLSTQTSRQALAWKTGGNIRLFSLSETKKNSNIAGQGAIGIGGDLMILDECVDGDTEILTEHGFVKFKDLKDGVKVAQYHLSGEIEMVMPTKVTRQPAVKRKAYAVTLAPGIEPVIMTENHRQVVWDKRYDYPVLKPISEVDFDKDSLVQAFLVPYNKLYQYKKAFKKSEVEVFGGGWNSEYLVSGIFNAKPTKELIDFDGPTYCVSVPSTMFIARKGHIIFATGNTQLISNRNYYTARRFFIESSQTKLVELGNPLSRGHFWDTYTDPKTFVIHMSDVTTIIEGRMRRADFEMTNIPKHTQEYRSFVLNLFPPATAGDGFFPTMPQSTALLKIPQYRRTSFIGLDSAYKGGDSLILTITSLCEEINGDKKWVQVEKQIDLKTKYPTWTETTTLNLCLDILRIWDDWNIVSGCIDIGFGIHIYEMLHQLRPGIRLEPVNFGSKPTEERKEIHYSATWAYNLRAEMHLDLKELCEGGFLYLAPETMDELIRQMQEIRSESEVGKIKIEAKSKIKGRLGYSPDQLDSACLSVRAMIMSGEMGGQQGLEDEDVIYIEA